MCTKEGEKLAALIRRAIADMELSMSEYDEIVTQAYADGIIDHHENRLLSELQQLIAEGIIKRVPD